MHPGNEFSISAIRRKRDHGGTDAIAAGVPAAFDSPVPAPAYSAARSAPTVLLPASPRPDAGGDKSPSPGFSLPFDPLRVLDAIYIRLWLVLIPALAVGVALAWVGLQRFATHYTAVAQIIKQAPRPAIRQSESGDVYQPHELAIPTLMALMRSSTLMEKVCARLDSKVSEGTIKAGLTVAPERNTDIVRVSINSDVNADTAVRILIAYVEEVLTLSREIQRHEAADMNLLLSREAQTSERELATVNQELLAYSQRENVLDVDKQMDAWLGELANFNMEYETKRLDHETLDLKIHSVEKELAKVSPAASRLQQAREEVAQLEMRYTHEHPILQEAIARVAALAAAVADEKPNLDAPPKPGESSVAETLYLELVRLRAEKQVLAEQLKKFAELRDGVHARLDELPRKSMGYARIKARKQALETSQTLLAARQREAELQEQNAQGSYRLLSMARLQDVLVERPTKKLVMVSAGGFAAVAFAIGGLIGLLAALDPRLVTVADAKRATGLPVLGALRLGKKTNPEDWAFRTWIHLQPKLALPPTTGAIVCGLITPSSASSSRLPQLLARAACDRGNTVILISHNPPPDAPSLDFEDALSAPEKVLRTIGGTSVQPLHALRLDSEWRWDAPSRHRWERALRVWSQARNTYLLVELADPSLPDTLLVAESMPNLLWLTSSEHARTAELSATLATYRAAGCRLVGLLMDHLRPFRFGLLNHLVPTTACLLLLASPFSQAAATVLGPGDSVNISAIGLPDFSRSAVTVGPDGTLTYLQAQNVSVSGLTIDELRTKLAGELRRYYKNLMLVVTPAGFQSHKVYVLGKVVRKGAINIDRPLTILEVVAEAGGLETGLFQQNTVELADLGRSFLVRGRDRMPVNMEALFLRGDTKQNIQVQAGDYLYFPSANSNEIYVLGNVKMQGAQGLLSHTSVHSAIAQAGGFTPRAYQGRVLVVRGSLEAPRTFAVDMKAILAGREMGFRLEPKDIVFIADKPWARAEDLLQFALSAFIQGAVAGWAGGNIGPFIDNAVLPQLR